VASPDAVAAMRKDFELFSFDLRSAADTIGFLSE
jgi:hypothetical protein